MLQNYQLLIGRAGTQEVLIDRSIPFFSRSFTISNLRPGVAYDMILRGVFGDVVGVDSVITVTTDEEGKEMPHGMDIQSLILAVVVVVVVVVVGFN